MPFITASYRLARRNRCSFQKIVKSATEAFVLVLFEPVGSNNQSFLTLIHHSFKTIEKLFLMQLNQCLNKLSKNASNFVSKSLGSSLFTSLSNNSTLHGLAFLNSACFLFQLAAYPFLLHSNLPPFREEFRRLVIPVKIDLNLRQYFSTKSSAMEDTLSSFVNTITNGVLQTIIVGFVNSFACSIA